MCRSASILAAALLASAGTAALAQTSNDIAGTWMVVSVKEEKSGQTTDFFGPNPQGQMMFDSNGRFMQILMRDDVPKIVGQGRFQATPDEAQAVLRSIAGYYGTYALPESGKLVLRIERATLANWNGTEQQRTFRIEGDELRMINPPNLRAGTVETVWRRMK